MIWSLLVLHDFMIIAVFFKFKPECPTNFCFSEAKFLQRPAKQTAQAPQMLWLRDIALFLPSVNGRLACLHALGYFLLREGNAFTCCNKLWAFFLPCLRSLFHCSTVLYIAVVGRRVRSYRS